MAGARRRLKKSVDAAANKKDVGRGKCYVCGSEGHFAHKHCGMCKRLEHRTCDCEERGVEKGAMLAKMNVPAGSEVGLITATIEAAGGGGNEE